MARIRSLKPEAFTSETLAACSVQARWQFAGLWCYVDDEGRGRANAGLIKAAVWPLDDDVDAAQVTALLDELGAARLICRYQVGGKSYLHIVNFGEHQHPNRPVASRLPTCSRSTHGGLTEDAVSPHNKGCEGGGKPPVEPPAAPRSDKTAQNGHAPGKPAGQGALTEYAVSPHGALITKSSSTPPTPLRNVLGEGVGGGDQQSSTVGAKFTAQTVLGDFIDWDRANGGTLTQRTRGQVAKTIADLLAQNVPDRHIRSGLADWRASGKHPSTLDSFVNARMKGAGRDPPRSSTSAERAQQALAAGANVQAMLDRGELPS